MVKHIILADILLIARIFPRPCGARKNTTQLAKYQRVLYVKPSNKMYVLDKQLKAVDLSQRQTDNYLNTLCQYLPCSLLCQMPSYAISFSTSQWHNPA